MWMHSCASIGPGGGPCGGPCGGRRETSYRIVARGWKRVNRFPLFHSLYIDRPILEGGGRMQKCRSSGKRRQMTLKVKSSTQEEEETGRKDAGPKYALKVNNSWAAILADKVIDSADDISIHLRRIWRNAVGNQGQTKFVKDETGNIVMQAAKPVILVLGSGWAAHSLIKVIDTDYFDVVCVSPSNAFLFTPMLPSTAVGTVEFRSLLEPIRVANPFVSYFEAICEDIDIIEKKATCTSSITDGSGNKPRFEIPYDMLVVAVGERPASFGVPGVEKHAFYLKAVRDAVNLRRRIQEVFELASLPGASDEDIVKLLTFVVVGGGPTGVEFSGTLTDFLREDLRKKYPSLTKYIRLILLQSGDSILTQFDKRLASIAMKNLQKIGVDVRTGQRVVNVEEDRIILSDGDAIEYGVCVWSAGNAPNPLVQDMISSIPQQIQLNGGKARKLYVDPFLRVIGAKDTIALGDCSVLTAGSLPPTAQVAAQQGAYAAHVLNRRYNVGTGGIDMLPPWKSQESLGIADRIFASVTDSVGESMDDDDKKVVILKKPFEFLSLGIMASVGNDKAIAQVEAFDNKLNVWGSPAFLLWKSVYITKQVSLRNRVLILFDWLKTRVFGRDLSQF